MKKYFKPILIALIILISFSSNASIKNNLNNLEKRTLAGQDLIFAGKYNEAIKHFKEIIKDYPESPAGYFGEAAAYEIKMLEDENFKYADEVQKVMKIGSKVAQNVEAESNPNLFNLFVAASLYGLEGFFYARKHNWWDAYTKGVVSRQIFRRVKSMDPNFIDADFGDGMYIFWRSVYSQSIWFLRIFPDRRKEGIALVKAVAEKGTYAKDIAKVNLGIMYFEEKEYSKALSIFQYYINRYPDNALLWQLKGKVQLAAKNYNESRKSFFKALSLRPKLKKPHYFLGLGYYLSKGDLNLALEEFDIFLESNPKKLWKSYTYYWKGRIYEQKGMKKEAKEEYKKAVYLNKGLRNAKFRLQAMGGGI